MSDNEWDPPWRCPWTGKWRFTSAPDFTGIDPDTGEPWSPRKVVALLGIRKSSGDETRVACEKVLADNPDKVAAYRSGKTKLIGFFVKLVMDATERRADPKDTTRILAEILNTPV